MDPEKLIVSSTLKSRWDSVFDDYLALENVNKPDTVVHVGNIMFHSSRLQTVALGPHSNLRAKLNDDELIGYFSSFFLEYKSNHLSSDNLSYAPTCELGMSTEQSS
jgi:hypothetical protein